jgi:2-haloalkanoic acid dehalogenase type II
VTKIGAVVFDFYETLVQLTTAQREELFDSVALELGLELPAGEAYHHWAVYTTRDADLRLGGTERSAFDGKYPPFVTFGEVWKHRSAELLRHWESDAHQHHVADAYVRAHSIAPLYPDVRPAIEELRGRYELAILSDADTDFIEAALEHNNLSFDTIVTSEDLQTYKPNIVMFREVCARLGVEPAEAAYVGDSPWHDIAGARHAGMRAIWLNRHERDWPEDIEPPEVVIRTLGELPGILDTD